MEEWQYERTFKDACAVCKLPAVGRRVLGSDGLCAKCRGPTEFELAKLQLEALEAAEKYEPPQERVTRAREWERERRRSLLPADRRCRLCGEVKVKSRSWVVFFATELLDYKGALTEMIDAGLNPGLGACICVSCARARELKKTGARATRPWRGPRRKVRHVLESNDTGGEWGNGDRADVQGAPRERDADVAEGSPDEGAPGLQR